MTAPPTPESHIAPRWRWGFASAWGVGLTLFQLIVTYVVPIDSLLHLALFLALSCAMVFVAGAGRVGRWGSWGLALLASLAGAYFWASFNTISVRWPLIDRLSPLAIACGVAYLVVILETTRRTVGLALVVVTLAFLAYAFAGDRLPGLLGHRAMTPAEVIDHLVFTSNGVFSAPVAVAATYVFIFVLFGTVLERSGGGDFMFRLAGSLTGRTRGGPAKIAVVSSAIYGSISGSPTSNVMTTGLFTIPMMSRSGFRPEVAGAIEAVAATGGALLPPVMGSAAFLMAELTGISYLRICVAATIPALLFYGVLLLQVHWTAARLGLPPARGDAEPALALLTRDGVELLPLLALVFLLMLGWSPLDAAGAATLVALAVSWRRRATRITLARLPEILDLTARRSLMVTAACAAAGIVVGTIVTTGIGGKITSLVFGQAAASLPAALLATAVVCTILGMGVPVPSAYVVTAVLAGPALARLGLTPMAANLFILYFASLSAITPPVAVAAFAAASIANVNPNRVGLEACRFGFVAFVLPFYFVYREGLLFAGTPTDIASAVVPAALGVIYLGAAVAGHARSPLGKWERAVLLIAGLGLIVPGMTLSLACAALGALVLRRQLLSPAMAGAPRHPPSGGL